MRKTTQFRRLLESPELECILEAHNGLSARIAEEAGFQGIWASGLCLSSQFGVRDSNARSPPRGFRVADLPFEVGCQDNGDLYPTGQMGDLIP